MGKGTYLDIPPHLRAAMRVLTLRFFDTPAITILPFDCLALESVLYQIFLTSTVLWTDTMPLTEFDLSFWMKAEQFLERTVLFPGRPSSLNSPVLGVPVSLFRLTIQAKQALQTEVLFGPDCEQLRTDIQDWEIKLLARQPLDPSQTHSAFERQEIYYDGTTFLYVLIVSLLLEQLEQSLRDATTTSDAQCRLPEPVPRHTWQIRKAMSILRAFENDEFWTSCYIGNWPVYTIGFFLEDPADISLIRHDMDRRWTCTKFMQITRFRNDLEATWKQRDLHRSISDRQDTPKRFYEQT
jgi:hypothetical protein